MQRMNPSALVGLTDYPNSIRANMKTNMDFVFCRNWQAKCKVLVNRMELFRRENWIRVCLQAGCRMVYDIIDGFKLT